MKKSFDFTSQVSEIRSFGGGVFFFFSFLPSCNSPKGASYQRAVFSSTTTASRVTAMPATNLLVLSWWSGESRQVCARRDCWSLEWPEGLHSCPVWSPQTEVLLSLSYSGVKLSQPLHCFIQHTLTCLCPRQAQAMFMPLHAVCLAPGQL